MTGDSCQGSRLHARRQLVAHTVALETHTAVMRSITLLGRRCCRLRRTPSILHVFLQPVRKAHASTEPVPASSEAPTTSSPDCSSAEQTLPSSASDPSSTAALFPSGSPIIVSTPSHFYLSPAEQAQRDASVARHLHRQRLQQAAYDNADKSHLRVSFDLSYAHPTRQAATSLITQLRVIAHHNRTTDYPACVHINALDPRILSDEPLALVPTPKPWEAEPKGAAASQFVRDMRQRWSDGWLMHRTTASVASSFDSNELVFLSPDAQHILWRVSPQFVYVVGGIIDKHSVTSKLSLWAANKLRVQSARLPIRECLPGGLRRAALNIDVVFALLLHVHQAAEQIRHSQQPATASTSPSSSVADAVGGRGLQTVYGLQWYPRRRGRLARSYRLPVFGVSECDEGIDWHRLWCQAFDAVIPTRLRWTAEEQARNT